MAPVRTNVNYYQVLEIDESADSKTITKSYRRLALLYHPDRNKDQNATGKFQAIGEAYETLKDEGKRRTYDLTYSHTKPTSKGNPPTFRSTPSAAGPEEDDTSWETAQIAAILKAKQERGVKWAKTKKCYDDAIFELERDIRKLQTTIKGLEEIDRVEDAEKAAANSWSTWLLSPIYQKRVETEEEKESKARERLQRLHNKNFKQADLTKKESQLKNYRDRLRNEQDEFNRANIRDDTTESWAYDSIRAKRLRAQKERERLAAEERARIQKEELERQQKEAQERAKAAKERRERQEKEAAEQQKRAQETWARQQREASEARERSWREYQELIRKRTEEKVKAAKTAQVGKEQQEKEGATQQKKQREQVPRGFAGAYRYPFEHAGNPYPPMNQAAKSACDHREWWDKVEGRLTCEKCSASHYAYLLECPSCKMKACASCQQQIRTSRVPRMGRKKPDTPPQWHNDYYDYD